MIYAIDFGTSNSLLGAATGNLNKNLLHRPIPLDLDAKDPSVLRSIMFFPDGGTTSFGMRAIEEYVRHGQDEQAGRLIRSVKKFLPQQSFAGTTISGKNTSIEEIVSVFLKEMRSRANQHFQRDVTAVVLGRPARFSDDELLDKLAQDRLEKAARLAGFSEVHFYPEPLAAAYEFKSTLTQEKTVLVTDFGGGTSDFTVIKLKPHALAFDPSDVLSIGGISIAGDALDATIMRKGVSHYFGSDVRYKVPFGSNILTMPVHLMEKICSPADISILRKRDTVEFFKNVKTWALRDKDREKMDRLFTLVNDQIGFSLFEEIERTKKALGEKSSETLIFNHADIEVEQEISALDFESFAAERIEQVLLKIDATVKNAGLQNSDIDLICATGGTAKVPAIARGLAIRFQNAKVLQHNHFHSIVEGLIRFAGDLSGK